MKKTLKRAAVLLVPIAIIVVGNAQAFAGGKIP